MPNPLNMIPLDVEDPDSVIIPAAHEKLPATLTIPLPLLELKSKVPADRVKFPPTVIDKLVDELVKIAGLETPLLSKKLPKQLMLPPITQPFEPDPEVVIEKLPNVCADTPEGQSPVPDPGLVKVIAQFEFKFQVAVGTELPS
jgi:hypothetical protein